MPPESGSVLSFLILKKCELPLLLLSITIVTSSGLWRVIVSLLVYFNILLLSPKSNWEPLPPLPPCIRIFPSTCNLDSGAVIPIPTLPVAVIVIFSVKLSSSNVQNPSCTSSSPVSGLFSALHDILAPSPNPELSSVVCIDIYPPSACVILLISLECLCRRNISVKLLFVSSSLYIWSGAIIFPEIYISFHAFVDVPKSTALLTAGDQFLEVLLQFAWINW